MEAGIDLNSASREVLIAVIVRQQAIIERLEKRIAQLEGQAKPPGSRRMPGLKPKAGRKPAQPKGPRKSRPQGFARTRMTPTQRVEHVMEHCPDCGTQLSGGWTQRTREVIAVPVVEAEVTEHVYMARTCPGCRRRCIPPAQLDGVALGRQRLGVNPESSSGQALISLIAMLREDARLPIGTIQRYLRTVHELRVSRGAIVDAVHRTARKAQGVVAGILERIRGSPVVHADETGWCEDCHNGYVWTFSAPTQRYFPCSSQGQALRRNPLFKPRILRCAGAGSAAGQPRLCCRRLRALYPDDAPLARWADAVHRLYTGAKAFTHPQARRRRTAQLALERQLLAVCRLYLTDTSAAQSRLCRRIQRHIKSLPRTGCGELFVFVAEPEVPADNNAAERSLRHLVISRKISGGTRSEAGADSKMTLASLFGTWRTQGFNPLAACRQLLTFPQP